MPDGNLADVEKVEEILQRLMNPGLAARAAWEIVDALGTKWIVWTPWTRNGDDRRVYLHTFGVGGPVWHTSRPMALQYDTEDDARAGFTATRWQVGGVERSIPLRALDEEPVR